jgi:hypothetical protein
MMLMQRLDSEMRGTFAAIEVEFVRVKMVSFGKARPKDGKLHRRKNNVLRKQQGIET